MRRLSADPPAPPSPDFTRKSRSARSRLLGIFQRNGYLRVPREERLAEGSKKYKKGWEARLVLTSEDELQEVRRLIADAGLKPGRPFKKRTQIIQPLYGRHAVTFFAERPTA